MKYLILFLLFIILSGCGLDLPTIEYRCVNGKLYVKQSRAYVEVLKSGHCIPALDLEDYK